MTLSPSAFTADEFTPVHRNSLAYLQGRVEDVSNALGVLRHALESGYSGTGAPTVLELVQDSLATLREELQPENLHSPAAREGVTVCARQEETVTTKYGNAFPLARAGGLWRRRCSQVYSRA